MEEQPVVNTQIQQPPVNPATPKQNYWMIAIIVFVLLLIIGSIYTLVLQPKKEIMPPKPLALPSPTSPTPTPDPTANWEIYKDKKYGFKIKYPNNWAIEAPYIGPDPTGYDFAVQISNVKNPFGIWCGETERETGINPCASNQAIYISLKDLALRKTTFQEIIRSSGKSDEQKVVVVNGLNFVKVGETSPMYLIQKGNIVYSFSAIGSNVIFDQILSTFKFTE